MSMRKILKKAIAEEFMYRARYDRTQYSVEEIIYITNKVIDDEYWQKRHRKKEALENESNHARSKI